MLKFVIVAACVAAVAFGQGQQGGTLDELINSVFNTSPSEIPGPSGDTRGPQNPTGPVAPPPPAPQNPIDQSHNIPQNPGPRPSIPTVNVSILTHF